MKSTAGERFAAKWFITTIKEARQGSCSVEMAKMFDRYAARERRRVADDVLAMVGIDQNIPTSAYNAINLQSAPSTALERASDDLADHVDRPSGTRDVAGGYRGGEVSMSTTIRTLIERGVISLDTVVLGEPMLTRDGAWIGSGGEFYVWKRWTDGNARRAVAIDGKNRKYLVRVSNKDQSWSADRAFASADVARLEGNTHDLRRDIRDR